MPARTFRCITMAGSSGRFGCGQRQFPSLTCGWEFSENDYRPRVPHATSILVASWSPGGISVQENEDLAVKSRRRAFSAPLP